MTIFNWTPAFDHIYFGNSAAGLDATTQLPLITFDGKQFGQRILSKGENCEPPISTVQGDFNQNGFLDAEDLPSCFRR